MAAPTVVVRRSSGDSPPRSAPIGRASIPARTSTPLTRGRPGHADERGPGHDEPHEHADGAADQPRDDQQALAGSVPSGSGRLVANTYDAEAQPEDHQTDPDRAALRRALASDAKHDRAEPEEDERAGPIRCGTPSAPPP